MNPYPFRNLHDFISALERLGELKTISAEVDPDLEITEIVNRTVKASGPALLFNRVKGSRIPLVTNLFGSQNRLHAAFGVDSLQEVAERVQQMCDWKTSSDWIEKFKSLLKLPEILRFAPRRVDQAPCQEVVIQTGPMLDQLPIQKCWPQDGGRFITLPLVMTKDPVTGRRNVGMYRMQVFDNQTTGMHWQVRKDGRRHFDEYARRGKRMEVAVALGGDPVTIYSATAPLPPDFDEFHFAGILRQASVEMVRCKTVDFEIPAESEIVLEGYVDPQESRMEGPFGDHTGFYSLPKPFAVFHVTCMTHRRDPVYPSMVVGRPPMEDCFLGKATERIFLPLARVRIPELADWNFPLEGVFHNCVLVSIRKRRPHQAKEVIEKLWKMGQLVFTKYIIVFDENVNVRNVQEAAWQAFSNVDPKRDFVFETGPVDELDHSASKDCVGSKLGIDATRKGPEEGMKRPWPEKMEMSEEIKKRVEQRWKEYGF